MPITMTPVNDGKGLLVKGCGHISDQEYRHFIFDRLLQIPGETVEHRFCFHDYSGVESVGVHSHGGRVVARAWCDPQFKAALLDDGYAAVQSMGIDAGPAELTVLENTERVHNVVVCTLCSCYPRLLLGRPPRWYKSRDYRARVVKDPRQVLREFGTEIDDSVEVRVHDSTAELRYLVLPRRPAGSERMSEQQLAQLVTRDSMIGVSEVRLEAG